MMGSRNANQYRQAQEAFVSNHGGSSSQEVIYAILPNVCGVLLTTTTLGVLGKYTNRNVRIFIEFILTVIPCILCYTVLSDHVIGVCLSMMLISIINIAFIGLKLNASSNSELHPISGRRPFLTHFRSLINITTAICILAVDFRVFPRKFAKTEVLGYSLMDTGVGLFILANGLVAPEARDFVSRSKSSFVRTLTQNIKKCTKSCVPLLILGFGRFMIVEYIGYQKHVTEYGVHWNFFITLAFVKLFTSTITSTINSRYSLLSGIWILVMHEYILNTKGVKEWVLSDMPRIDFVSANREGLVSLPGYVGLYLISVAIGRLIHSTYQNLDSSRALHNVMKSFNFKIFGYDVDGGYNESMVLCIKLSLIAAQACTACLFCDSYFGVSRRLANAGYCMWIITVGVTMLTLLLLLEVVTDILVYAVVDNKHMPRVKLKRRKANPKSNLNVKDSIKMSTVKRTLEICEVVNYNGLFFFLFCNLSTGAVNMFVRTLYADHLTAITILIVYMAINIIFVLVLYRWQIQLKL